MGCWIELASPQPDEGDGVWRGNTAEDGAIYNCVGIDRTGARMIQQVFLDQLPPDALVPANPAVLAIRATDSIPLAKADIHTAPAAPDLTWVRLKTWLWIPAGQWQPLTGRATAGPTTVVATVTPVKVSWDLGEDMLTCEGPGRVWEDWFSDEADTDCGYTYHRTSAAQPGETYPISAHITYSVAWTCMGACTSTGGTLDDIDGADGNAGLRVGERRSVIVENPGE